MSNIVLTPGDSKKARAYLNLSQAKAASGAGINRAYLSQFESGTRILDEATSHKLSDLYISEGWVDSFEEEEEELGIKQCAFQFRDGFVLPSQLLPEDIDRLLGEYQDNLTEIKNQIQLKASFTFLFRDLDDGETLVRANKLLMLMARNFSIVTQLHGQNLVIPMEKKTGEIKTLGDFVQNLFVSGADGAGGAF